MVDALSKKDEDVESLLYAISILQPKWILEARDEWRIDEEVWTLIHKLEKDPIAYIYVRTPNSNKRFF